MQPQSTKVSRNNNNENHPLMNQQLLNGYIKNPNAASSVRNKKGALSVVQVQGQNFSMLQKQLSEVAS